MCICICVCIHISVPWELCVSMYACMCFIGFLLCFRTSSFHREFSLPLCFTILLSSYFPCSSSHLDSAQEQEWVSASFTCTACCPHSAYLLLSNSWTLAGCCGLWLYSNWIAKAMYYCSLYQLLSVTSFLCWLCCLVTFKV